MHIPRTRPSFVHRPRLSAKLSAGLNGKFTLVSAPAGSGKTAMLADWTRSCDRPIAWFALDSGDNDPTRFWTHVVAALNELQPGIGKSAVAGLKSAQAPPMRLLLAGLINEIVDTFSSFILILDDYHAIKATAVHDGLTLLIDHMPRQMHLVIATRSDPPLPIGSLRGQGELNELRTTDLRFTREEIELLMNRSMGLGLTEKDIELLDRRTEGWIVGLQLAALSMQDRIEKHSFVVHLAGDNRFIADYLMEEVLQGQPKRVQDFMLQTSILDYLTASLCQAVTRMSDCYQILAELEQKNLFIAALDENRVWFRYHPLFADLLHVRLERTYGEASSVFHERASRWFETHDLPLEAIKHAFTMGDLERAANLIERKAINLIGYGEIQTVVALLDKFPEHYFMSYPWLNISRAWISLLGGQLDDAEAQAQQVENALSDHKKTDQIAGHIATIRSCVAAYKGNQVEIVQYAQEGLTKLPDEDYMARGLAYLMLGLAYRWQGDLGAAIKAYADAERVSRRSGDYFTAIYATCFKGYALTLTGKLHEAHAIFQEALDDVEGSTRRGGWKPPVLGLLHSFLSGVLLEWDDLDAAAVHAQKGLDLSEKWGNTNAILDGFFFYINVLLATQDHLYAEEAIKKAQEAGAGVTPWAQLDGALLAVQLLLAQGDVQHAGQKMEEMGIGAADEISFQNLQYHLGLARVLFAKGELAEALDLLERSLAVAKEAGARARMIEIYVTRALVWQRQGKKPLALKSLQQALRIAEPEGFVNTFIREGPFVEELLRATVVQGISPQYASRLLAALEKRTELLREQEPATVSPLVEPLSEREFQVLRLLAIGLTSSEIAEELFIATSTARTHIKHIYQKLNVHRRLEAVEKAKKLNLV